MQFTLACRDWANFDQCVALPALQKIIYLTFGEGKCWKMFWKIISCNQSAADNDQCILTAAGPSGAVGGMYSSIHLVCVDEGIYFY